MVLGAKQVKSFFQSVSMRGICKSILVKMFTVSRIFFFDLSIKVYIINIDLNFR